MWVDGSFLQASRPKFYADLPKDIDPCGESGKFHSFIYEIPIFKNPIAVQAGEVFERDDFIFENLFEI